MRPLIACVNPLRVGIGPVLLHLLEPAPRAAPPRSAKGSASISSSCCDFFAFRLLIYRKRARPFCDADPLVARSARCISNSSS